MLRVHCVVPELRSGTGLEEARSHLTPKSFGGHSEGEIPGSIPNPEVKPFSADGTATGRSWESRTSPDILSVRAAPRGRPLLFPHLLFSPQMHSPRRVTVAQERQPRKSQPARGGQGGGAGR